MATSSKSNIKWIVAAVVGGAGLLLTWMGAYTLDETEQVVITRFGDPVGTVREAGLHFKLPFVHTLHRFDKRVLPWDGDVADIVTQQKKNITIDTTARWRIADPLLFKQRVTNETGAQTRLDDILGSQVETAIADTELVEVVRSKDWEVAEEDLEQVVRPEGEGKKLKKQVRTGRQQLVQRIKDNASQRCADMGIELLDVRIKRINYVERVQQSVFDRMISERKRIATKFREEGKEEAQKIRAEADRKVAEIKAEANRKAEVIRGEADAEATRIYNDAYGSAPEFYAFSRTLKSYGEALTDDSVLMLSTDSAYFRYLRQLRPETTPTSPAPDDQPTSPAGKQAGAAE
jgi:membrane protease subunit HflC